MKRNKTRKILQNSFSNPRSSKMIRSWKIMQLKKKNPHFFKPITFAVPYSDFWSLRRNFNVVWVHFRELNLKCAHILWGPSSCHIWQARQDLYLATSPDTSTAPTLGTFSSFFNWSLLPCLVFFPPLLPLGQLPPHQCTQPLTPSLLWAWLFSPLDSVSSSTLSPSLWHIQGVQQQWNKEGECRWAGQEVHILLDHFSLPFPSAATHWGAGVSCFSRSSVCLLELQFPCTAQHKHRHSCGEGGKKHPLLAAARTSIQWLQLMLPLLASNGTSQKCSISSSSDRNLELPETSHK